ncbi:MAG: hypothetical protein PVH03_13050 [Chloroflexota bacterium]|jgi:hypothetical protein
MFDFIRDLRKSDEEKRQEAITAYLDGYLTPSERQRFEEKLAADPGLRREVEQQSFIKQNLQQLPQVRAPRSFTLDPAQYGAPEPDTAVRLYPILRTATVLVGIFFVIAVGASLLIPQGGPIESLALAPMAGEVADEARGGITEAEQELMEEPIEEMASPIFETEMFAEEEAAVEAPVEETTVPAEETVAGTPSADTVIEAEDQAGEETMEEEAVAQEAVPEGELEEAEPGISAAAPATAEGQRLTEEAARAGGIGTKPATEIPPVEAPAEEALEAEALPAEPLPTAPPPTPAETPSFTPPQLAEVEPTSPAVGQELTGEAAPTEDQQELEQQDFGGTAFTLLSILAVVLGIAVIVLSGATLLVRRKI